jgi:hypothetical protein
LAGSFFAAVERSAARDLAAALPLIVESAMTSVERAAEKTLSSCPPTNDGTELNKPSRVSYAPVTSETTADVPAAHESMSM